MTTLVSDDGVVEAGPIPGPMLRCSDLCVNEASAKLFSIPRLELRGGSFVAILGESGCGKSTFLRLLAGLPLGPGLVADGAIGLDDQTPEAFRRRYRIGIAFQQTRLFPWLTVRSNVDLPLRVSGSAMRVHADDHVSAEEALGRAQVPEQYWDKRPNLLSGGTAYRVSFARAVVGRVRFVLLDEPFTGADELLRDALLMQLLAFWRRYLPTVVMVTHSISEAARVATHALVMKRSREPEFLTFAHVANRSDGDARLIEGSLRSALQREE